MEVLEVIRTRRSIRKYKADPVNDKTVELVLEAARAVAEDARPIDDHRGSAWYRVRMVELLTARLLRTALKRARGNQ